MRNKNLVIFLILFIGCNCIETRYRASDEELSILNTKNSCNCLFYLKKAEIYNSDLSKNDCDDCYPAIAFDLELINMSPDTLFFYLGYYPERYDHETYFKQISNYCKDFLCFRMFVPTRGVDDPVKIHPFDTLNFSISRGHIPFPYDEIINDNNKVYKDEMVEIAKNTKIVYTLNIQEEVSLNVIKNLVSTQFK
jgi:hypothetical protein